MSQLKISDIQNALNVWFQHRHIPIAKLKVDGIKGPSTNWTIREFKLCVGWSGHDIDPIVGPKTQRALGLTKPRYIATLAERSRGGRYRRSLIGAAKRPRSRVVWLARSYAGHTTEHPPGSNRGGVISLWETKFGFGAVSWCGVFCANMLLHVGVREVTSRLASVALIEEDAKRRRGPFTGWTTHIVDTRPGDLVVLFGYGVHVEIVERIVGNVVHTIGGNTSSGNSGSQANGGGVFARVRSLSDVRGFARVNYPEGV